MTRVMLGKGWDIWHGLYCIWSGSTQPEKNWQPATGDFVGKERSRDWRFRSHLYRGETVNEVRERWAKSLREEQGPQGLENKTGGVSNEMLQNTTLWMKKTLLYDSPQHPMAVMGYNWRLFLLVLSLKCPSLLMDPNGGNPRRKDTEPETSHRLQPFLHLLQYFYVRINWFRWISGQLEGKQKTRPKRSQ